MTNHAFGPFGISTGLDSSPHSIEAAQAAEELGYPVIWLSGGPLPGLQTIVDLVEATRTITFATGILAASTYSPEDVSTTYAQLETTHPGRFIAGLGGAHTRNPIGVLSEYLDRLDGIPAERQVLAALGPRMLKLAATRTAGAYPFLVTPAYSAEARRILGPGKLLAVNHLVVVEPDPDRARAIARDTISFFPQLPAYAASLTRQGFTESEIAELPDHVVDALAAWGTPADIRAKLTDHLTSGADHVALNVITGITGPQPIPQWRTLAPTLLT